MATFLLKTEPSEYSFYDLVREGRTAWSGISNAAALIHVRAALKGDQAFIYHTGTARSIVGLAEIVTDAYEDPARPGKNDKGRPKFAALDIRPVKKARTPITLAQIKADKRFAKFLLVTRARLSVMPVPPDLDKALRRLAGL